MKKWGPLNQLSVLHRNLHFQRTSHHLFVLRQWLKSPLRYLPVVDCRWLAVFRIVPLLWWSFFGQTWSTARDSNLQISLPVSSDLFICLDRLLVVVVGTLRLSLHGRHPQTFFRRTVFWRLLVSLSMFNLVYALLFLHQQHSVFSPSAFVLFLHQTVCIS